MNPVHYLRAAGVPEALHAAALKSLAASRRISKAVLPYKLKAPFVLARAVQQLPWEAEAMPEHLWQYDNEISINGDHNPWLYDAQAKAFVRAPAPLEDTPAIRAACYYCKGHHPRSRLARYIWLGWRNRASKYAAELGPADTGETITSWGDRLTNNGHEGVVVWRMGEHWQIYAISKLGPLCVRRNIGFKVSNVFKHDAPRAMVVNIPFSLQRWKKPQQPTAA